MSNVLFIELKSKLIMQMHQTINELHLYLSFRYVYDLEIIFNLSISTLETNAICLKEIFIQEFLREG